MQDQRSTRASREALGKAENDYAAGVKNVRELNVKLIDMARANTDAIFDLARQIAAAEAPSDFVEIWSAHSRRQFELLADQAKELTALGQRIAAASAKGTGGFTRDSDSD